MKRILCVLLIMFIVVINVVSCSNSRIVNHNLSVNADNFEVLRKITVYNARTDLIIMEMEGYMSLTNNSSNELVVTCKIGDDEYKKNYVYLNEYVIYFVEDITGTITNPYHYRVVFYTPQLDVDVNP